MLTAACRDFTELGYKVLIPIDSRLQPQPDVLATKYPVSSETELIPTLERLARQVDKILIVAPETGNCLLGLLRSLRAHRSKLLNPGEEFTALASDKNRMQTWLSERGIPVPLGASADQWPSTPTPQANQLVLKPADGCGGHGLQILPAPLSQQDILAAVRSTGFSRQTKVPPKGGTTNDSQTTMQNHSQRLHQKDQQLLSRWRVEEYVEGTPASVSVIRSQSTTSEIQILPPLRQVFFDDYPGKFSHCQDDLPIDLATRAQDLAEQTVNALPDFSGFIGIDIVLGPRDVVIEINPRLTISYAIHRPKW